jgi:hypothetical protein
MEVYNYDYPLYYVIRYPRKMVPPGRKGAGQTSSGSSDGSKVNTPCVEKSR